MLTAIAVLAVVGGALAFKAKTFSDANVYCSTFASPNTCQKVLFTTTTSGTTEDPCTGDFFYKAATCPITTSFTTVGTGAIKVKSVTSL